MSVWAARPMVRRALMLVGTAMASVGGRGDSRRRLPLPRLRPPRRPGNRRSAAGRRSASLWGPACPAALAVVDVGAVGAQVLEEIVPLAEADAGVVGGDVAQGIGQHPIVVGGTADGAATDAEHDVASVPEQPAMITDNAQAERHGCPRGPLLNFPETMRHRIPRTVQSSPVPAGHIMPPLKLTGPPRNPWPPVTFSKSCL